MRSLDLHANKRMEILKNDPLLQVETTCGTLLYELQIIWDEVGESDSERDKMLLQLEQECLEVYRRKVDQANKSRAQLRQAIADSEAELAAICSAMGERPVYTRQSEQSVLSLKEELRSILPQVEEMRKRKNERKRQFMDVMEEIRKISNEIHKSTASLQITVDDNDLSLRRLEELHRELQAFQKEKSDRLNQILEYMSTLNSFCSVLGMDFKLTINEIHPSLGDSDGCTNLSDSTLGQLAATIKNLREVKLQRMQKLQDLATNLLELWHLMDTPIEEQHEFQNVTCNVAASEHELTEPNALSVDFLAYVEAEVHRLEALKSSKMKELVLKKRAELEEISRKTHLVPNGVDDIEYVLEAIDSGVMDSAFVLEQLEVQIGRVKEEALSRKDILEKVEKWSAACEEESWLEEYNRDENRYNAGRGAHLILKRAEKARALVNKLPAMVEGLASKTLSWEKERGTEFTYDGIRLLSMLEEYTILREEKEQERRWQRDQKKLQGQLIAEQEALYGSKPSPSKPQNSKRAPRMSTGGANNSRRVSLGGTMIPNTPKPASLPSSRPTTPQFRSTKKIDRLQKNDTDDGIEALSAARRGSDFSCVSSKKHCSTITNACETEPPIGRRPFSPISMASSKSSICNANLVEDQNMPAETTGVQQTTLFINNTLVPATPKTISAPEVENRTPIAVTPKTVSVAMMTAATPATTDVKLHREIEEETEYSFEERRAGFVLPKTFVKRVIQI